MNDAQLLKAYGRLTNVGADNLASVSVSPANKVMLSQRTCGCPDAPDREIGETVTSADIDKLASLLGVTREECEQIIEMHRRMLLAGSEDYNNNRWGKCVASFANNHALTYFLDLDTFPSHYKRPVVREELERVVEAGVFRWPLVQLLDECLGKPMVEIAYDYLILEAYRVLGCQHVRVSDKSKANVHVYGYNLPGTVIGRAWFTSGSCSDQVDHQIDKGYQPDLIGMGKLGCHEFGHNHGEPHQFGGQGTHHGVMSYDPPRLFYGYSNGSAPHKLPRDPSIQSLIDKYGGVPVPLPGPTPTPTPTPTPPPADKPNPDKCTLFGVGAISGKLHKLWIESL